MKLLFDRLMSLFGLVILSPVMLIVCVLIRLKMPGGPVIFKQKRVGKNGNLFTMYKFRSMLPLQGKDRNVTVAAAEQARITPLGMKLRKYKLDELPELWNVFIGDMSFVGPRPDVPGYADKLEGKDREILKLRPGITGPASLKYREEEELLLSVAEKLVSQGPIQLKNGDEVCTVEEYNDKVIYLDKVRINRYYLHHYSFFKDLEMIFATVFGCRIKYGGEII